MILHLSFQDPEPLSSQASSVAPNHLVSDYRQAGPENTDPVDLSYSRPLAEHHRALLGHHHPQDNSEYSPSYLGFIQAQPR